MKAQLTLATLALSLITTHVFAASSSAPFPLVGEARTARYNSNPSHRSPKTAPTARRALNASN